MLLDNPLEISQLFVSLLGTQISTYFQERIPQQGAILVVSNHRSFMDAPVLMTAVNRPIRFACHHYMGQVPLMREVVTRLGCFPLAKPEQRQQNFFEEATELLNTNQVVGIFPEGAQPMVQTPLPHQLGSFQRGFAHLALRAPIEHLSILPVAIASYEEHNNSIIPLQLLSLIDPSEPLFSQPGWHPFVLYQKVNALIGKPYQITQVQRGHYHGKQARSLVTEITETCHSEIGRLLSQGFY